ncbi:MAG TPA: AI-2E family transporter [Candidatus Acidoferrales bacterium]|nr:AI-2E family transporter [Candidatus Acidoferrales bacterium]
MKLFDNQTARSLGTILLFVAAGAFIYGARHVLIAFIFAILFAYVLEPWVASMQHWRKLSRGIRVFATLEVYAVILVALAIAFVLFGSDIVDEARMLLTNLPQLVHKVSTGQIVAVIGAKHGWSYHTQQALERFLRQHSAEVFAWTESIATQIADSLPNPFWIVLVPILAFFFLKDAGEMVQRFLNMIHTETQRSIVANILRNLNEMLAQYIRVQLIMAGMALAFYMGVLSLLRVPYSLVLGAIAGLLEFLPTLGPALAAAAILGIAFLAGYRHVFIIMLILGAWRVVQDYVTFPRLTNVKLRLHPLASIFAILVGAEIGGFAGAYLAIPIIAGVRIVEKTWEDRSRWRGPRPMPEAARR